VKSGRVLAIEFAITRTIRDAAALLDAVAGSMPGDPYAAVPPSRPYREEVGAPCGPLRIGILSGLGTVKIHPDCAKAVESTGACSSHWVITSSPRTPRLSGIRK
jgi:amidase